MGQDYTPSGHNFKLLKMKDGALLLQTYYFSI